MAKTKQATEPQSEKRLHRRRTPTTSNCSRLNSTEKSKTITKNTALASTSSKSKGKQKEKKELQLPKPTKKQIAVEVSTSRTRSSSKASLPSNELKRSLTDSKKTANHDNLLANMQSVRVNVQRLFSNVGELPKNWLTSVLLRDWQNHAKSGADTTPNRALKGIEYIPFPTLKLKEKDGVTYAMYHMAKKNTKDTQNQYGVMIIEPGREKMKSRTGQTIKFTVLCGIATYVTKDVSEHYGPGQIFTIPPKVKYGIKNIHSEPCFLNFFSYVQIN